MFNYENRVLFLIGCFISCFCFSDADDMENRSIIERSVFYHFEKVNEYLMTDEYLNRPQKTLVDKTIFDLFMKEATLLPEDKLCIFAFIAKNKKDDMFGITGVIASHKIKVEMIQDSIAHRIFLFGMFCKFRSLDGSPYVSLSGYDAQLDDVVVNYAHEIVGNIDDYNEEFAYQQIINEHREKAFKIQLAEQVVHRRIYHRKVATNYLLKFHPVTMLAIKQKFNDIPIGKIELTENYDVIEIIKNNRKSVFLSKNKSQRLLNVLSSQWDFSELNCEPETLYEAYEKLLYREGLTYYLMKAIHFFGLYGLLNSLVNGLFGSNHLLDLNEIPPCSCIFMYVVFGVKDLSRFPISPNPLIVDLGGSIKKSTSTLKPGSLIIISNNKNSFDNESLMYLGNKFFLAWARGPSFFYVRHASGLEDIFESDYTVNYIKSMDL